MSIPPSAGGPSGAGPSRGARREITPHFIRMGIRLVYERAMYGIKHVGTGWKQLVESFKKSGPAFKEADKGLENMASQMKKAGDAVAKGNEAVQDQLLAAAGAGEVAGGAFKVFRGELARTGSVLAAITSTVGYLHAGMERLHASMSKTGGQIFGAVGKQLEQLIGLLGKYRAELSVSAVMVGGWAYLAKQASNAYDTFVDVFQLLTLNRVTLQRMTTDFVKTAGAMFASAEELRSVADAAFQVGIREKDLREFSEQAYKMGRVLGLADSEAVDLLRNFQVMRFSREEIDKTTIAMRLLQERTGVTSREMAGVVERIRAISAALPRDKVAPFTLAMEKLAAQFKMMRMDVGSSIDQIVRFFDVSDEGARHFAAILGSKLGMQYNELVEGLKSGTVSAYDLAQAAEELVKQFGFNRAVLDAATRGHADWVYQLARGKDEAKAQVAAIAAMEEEYRKLGIDQGNLKKQFDKWVAATQSISVAWGRFKAVLGAVLVMIGSPLFNRLAWWLDQVTWAMGKLLGFVEKILATGRKLPEWVKNVLVFAPLVAGISSVLVVGGKLIVLIAKIGGGLLGLSGIAGTLATAFRVLVSPIVLLGRLVGWLAKFVGLGPAAAKAGQLIASAFGGIGTAALGLLGVLGKLVGSLSAILAAGQLLDPKGAREKAQGSMESTLKTIGFATVAGAAIGSVVPGVGTAVGAGVGLAVGAGFAGYNALTAPDQPTELVKTPSGEFPAVTGPQKISNEVVRLAPPVKVETPFSPVPKLSQADVVNAINDQTRALLLALRELGGLIARPSALELARMRFAGADGVYDRVTALEVG